MSQTAETVKDFLNDWVDHVFETADTLVDKKVPLSRKMRQFVYYSKMSEALIFTELGCVALATGFDIWDLSKGMINSLRENLEDLGSEIDFYGNFPPPTSI